MEEYLAKFNRMEMLRCLAIASYKIFKNHGDFFVNGVPIIPYIVHLAILRAVKCCTQDIERCPNDADMAYLFRMCHALVDNNKEELSLDPLELWMLYSYRQFPFQDRYFNAIARTIYLYRDLWPTINEASQIDCLVQIEKETGITLNEIMMYFLGAMACDTGFIFEYGQSDVELLAKRSSLILSQGSHLLFLNWCSGTCDQLLTMNKTQIPPLAIYPVIKTEFIPQGRTDEVYIITSYEYLLQKCTAGIFHLLGGVFDKGGGDNLFRVCFGKVFEAYVGKLLSTSLKSWKIIPEIAYKKNKKLVCSSDWFVLKGDRLIIIDVKHSALSLESKTTGSFSKIKNDLSQNLIKAVKQLDRTITDIQSDQYAELSVLRGAKKFQCVVVLNDTLHNANYIGRKLVQETLGELTFDLHVINIGELEDLLANLDRKQNLFGFLDEKAQYFGEMDFKEFVIRKTRKQGGLHHHSLLSDAYGSLFPYSR